MVKNTIFYLFWKKCPCSHNNNIVFLIKHISLFDTTIVKTIIPKVTIQNKNKINYPVWYCISHEKYLKFQFKILKKILFYQWGGQNTIKEYFTPIIRVKNKLIIYGSGLQYDRPSTRPVSPPPTMSPELSQQPIMPTLTMFTESGIVHFRFHFFSFFLSHSPIPSLSFCP